MLAEIRDGSLYMEVGDGQKRQSVTYPGTTATNFCDGQWRRVTFSKEGERVNITVRDQRSELTGNPAVVMELITVSPFYVGGIPAGSEAELFLRDNGIQAAPGIKKTIICHVLELFLLNRILYVKITRYLCNLW